MESTSAPNSSNPPIHRRRDLERLGDEMTQAALAGEGWRPLLRRVATATGRRARLVGVHGGLLAASDTSDGEALSVPASGVPASDRTEHGLVPPDASAVLAARDPVPVVCADGVAAAAIAIRAGRRGMGVLVLEGPLDELARAVLTAAVLPIAIEGARRDAEAAALAQTAGSLVDALRYGSLHPEPALERAARRFGLDLDEPHAAAVLAYEGHQQRVWMTAAAWIETPVRVEGAVAWTVLTGDVGGELHRIRRRLEAIVGDARVLAATGPLVRGIPATPSSFRLAEVTLALARQRGDRVELVHEQLGITGLLLGSPPEQLRAFVDRHLGPVRRRPELVATLRAWHRSGASRAGAAARLGVHRNTVGGRLGRAEKLLGVKLSDPAVALDLGAAIAADEILDALTAVDTSRPRSAT